MQVVVSVVTAIVTTLATIVAVAYRRGRADAILVTRDQLDTELDRHKKMCEDSFSIRFREIERRLDRIEEKLDRLTERK